MNPDWRATSIELENKYGPNWRKILKISARPVIRNKPVIRAFDEFPPDTKEIYCKLAAAIAMAAPVPFKLWALGSRVTGKWRTKEEEDKLAAEAEIAPKYSDYDYATTGPLPCAEHLNAVQLDGIKLDGFRCHAPPPRPETSVEIPTAGVFQL